MAGKTFPAFPAHVQPAILRIWQEAHWLFMIKRVLVFAMDGFQLRGCSMPRNERKWKYTLMNGKINSTWQASKLALCDFVWYTKIFNGKDLAFGNIMFAFCQDNSAYYRMYDSCETNYWTMFQYTVSLSVYTYSLIKIRWSCDRLIFISVLSLQICKHNSNTCWWTLISHAYLYHAIRYDCILSFSRAKDQNKNVSWLP